MDKYNNGQLKIAIENIKAYAPLKDGKGKPRSPWNQEVKEVIWRGRQTCLLYTSFKNPCTTIFSLFNSITDNLTWSCHKQYGRDSMRDCSISQRASSIQGNQVVHSWWMLSSVCSSRHQSLIFSPVNCVYTLALYKCLHQNM